MNETQTALQKREPQLELTHDGKGNDRTIARAADGKFAKKHTAAVKKSLSSTIDFLEGKDGDKTRAEKMRDALYKAVLNASPEDLVGMSKAIEAFEKFAFGSKGKDRVVEHSDPQSNAVKIILVNAPTLVNNEPKKETPQPLRPSFIDAEIIEEGAR